MNKDEKRVEYLIAHKNNLWTGIMLLIGGLSGILMTINYSGTIFLVENIVRFVLIALGGIFLPLMIIGVININLEIQNLLK